jgi:hypothetical protein
MAVGNVGNRDMMYNRTKAAASALHAAMEEARDCVNEYVGAGGSTYMTRFFYEEDLSTPRTDLSVSVADFIAAQTAMLALAATSGSQTIDILSKLPLLSLLK